MIPPKLKKGDEIRVIAPSRSMGIISPGTRSSAVERLERMGFKVSFGEHIEVKDMFDSSTIEARVEDLHQAFSDDNIKAILTVIGGFNVNQLLNYLDYALIKNNPKILCGYSDITALQNAIYAKTGLVTYSGPHFSSFGMRKGFEFTEAYFRKCLMSEKHFSVEASKEWSEDSWYKDQDARTFIENSGYQALNSGKAKGTIIGANLCTLNLLQGTAFMPSLRNSIVFVEDDHLSKGYTFDRDLQSLLHLPDFKYVKGLVIGRFQKASEIDTDKLKYVIKTKEELRDIPVISGVDFGHTTPQITFPIGGTVEIYADKGKASIKILEH